VSARGDGDNPISQVRKQQVAEREVAEVICSDLQLEAVGRTPLGCSHDAGVVDQHTELSLPPVRESVYGGEIGKIQLANLAIARNGFCCGLALSDIAYGKHDMRASVRERPRCRQPDAAVGAGDDESAPGL
jgi:hypothetical protein